MKTAKEKVLGFLLLFLYPMGYPFALVVHAFIGLVAAWAFSGYDGHGHSVALWWIAASVVFFFLLALLLNLWKRKGR